MLSMATMTKKQETLPAQGRCGQAAK